MGCGRVGVVYRRWSGVRLGRWEACEEVVNLRAVVKVK